MRPVTTRAAFEAALHARLRDAFADDPRVRVLRSEVRVLDEDGAPAGWLSLRYLARARGYVLDASADEPPALRALREEVSPPYSSRLLTDNAMTLTSSGERWRTFAPTAGGAVALPQDEAGVAATCDHVVQRLADVFVPRVRAVVDLRPEVTAHVAEHPGDYGWPVLTAVAAMRRHGLTQRDVDAERLLGRHVSRHRAFDAQLLASLG